MFGLVPNLEFGSLTNKTTDRPLNSVRLRTYKNLHVSALKRLKHVFFLIVQNLLLITCF